jgi:hypothetical protein
MYIDSSRVAPLHSKTPQPPKRKVVTKKLPKDRELQNKMKEGNPKPSSNSSIMKAELNDESNTESRKRPKKKKENQKENTSYSSRQVFDSKISNGKDEDQRSMSPKVPRKAKVPISEKAYPNIITDESSPDFSLPQNNSSTSKSPDSKAGFKRTIPKKKHKPSQPPSDKKAGFFIPRKARPNESQEQNPLSIRHGKKTLGQDQQALNRTPVEKSKEVRGQVHDQIRGSENKPVIFSPVNRKASKSMNKLSSPSGPKYVRNNHRSSPAKSNQSNHRTHSSVESNHRSLSKSDREIPGDDIRRKSMNKLSSPNSSNDVRNNRDHQNNYLHRPSPAKFRQSDNRTLSSGVSNYRSPSKSDRDILGDESRKYKSPRQNNCGDSRLQRQHDDYTHRDSTFSSSRTRNEDSSSRPNDEYNYSYRNSPSSPKRPYHSVESEDRRRRREDISERQSYDDYSSSQRNNNTSYRNSPSSRKRPHHSMEGEDRSKRREDTLERQSHDDYSRNQRNNDDNTYDRAREAEYIRFQSYGGDDRKNSSRDEYFARSRRDYHDREYHDYERDSYRGSRRDYLNDDQYRRGDRVRQINDECNDRDYRDSDRRIKPREDYQDHRERDYSRNDKGHRDYERSRRDEHFNNKKSQDSGVLESGQVRSPAKKSANDDSW